MRTLLKAALNVTDRGGYRLAQITAMMYITAMLEIDP